FTSLKTIQQALIPIAKPIIFKKVNNLFFHNFLKIKFKFFIIYAKSKSNLFIRYHNLSTVSYLTSKISYLFKSLALESFILQTIHRICPSRFKGLTSNSHKGNNKGNQTGSKEYPPFDMDMVNKVAQPFIHGPIS